MPCDIHLLIFLRVQVLGVEHSDVLDEIEQLRGRLRGMETAVVSGQQSPSAVKVGGRGSQGLAYYAI